MIVKETSIVFGSSWETLSRLLKLAKPHKATRTRVHSLLRLVMLLRHKRSLQNSDKRCFQILLLMKHLCSGKDDCNLVVAKLFHLICKGVTQGVSINKKLDQLGNQGFHNSMFWITILFNNICFGSSSYSTVYFVSAFWWQEQRGTTQAADCWKRGKNQEGIHGSKDQNLPAKL